MRVTMKNLRPKEYQMTYKKRLICLLSITGVLALLYIGSFIFNYDKNSVRSSSYTWLDPKAAEKTTRIVITAEGQDPIDFIKKNDKWFSVTKGNEYPVRAVRVEDFLNILTTRSSWPVRSSSSSSYEGFGLGDDSPRITVYGEFGIILDIIIGYDDIMGKETYIRKAGQSEVRSGESGIKSFLSNSLTSWYNIRLIPESESGGVDASSVQRLTVYNDGETQIFTRNKRGWDISGITVENPDFAGIDSYIGNVVNMEGEDFLDSGSVSDYTYDHSRFVLELGNGRIITIRMSAPDEMNKRYAQVSNSSYTYIIPLWTTVRIFRKAENFQISIEE